jgi:hypothetical protein
MTEVTMKRPQLKRALRATLTLVALGTAVMTVLGSTSAFAASVSPQASSGCVSKPGSPTRVGNISGIVGAVPSAACPGSATRNAVRNSGDTANGTPPLIWHGGAVMGTKLTGPLVVTPIFWHPAGHPMNAAYRDLITQYLGDVAKASGRNTNVFSIATEYFGTDGTIRYKIKLGTPIQDTNPLPADGCTVASTDTSNIYADNSGYNACLDDDQVIAETSSVVAAQGLPRDFAHIYVLFLPKHIESCFFPGPTDTAANVCTINYQPSAAYCAYHSFAGNNMAYANMPYPIYLSKTGFTCGTDVNYPGVIQTPNGNPDADTEISPTSHEVNEAWTDPDTVTGWYDSNGFENGDECAYIFGPTQGAPGAFYNQVISGHHYFTQEEFSNRSFFKSGGGCLQSERQAR